MLASLCSFRCIYLYYYLLKSRNDKGKPWKEKSKHYLKNEIENYY